MCYLCVGVNWRWVSVMWCRRQWHGLSTVFGPSRGRVRLHYECTWLASIRVGVVRVSRAITYGRCSRGGWARMWGARRCRRLSRDGSYVWCMREPSTVTLRGRGRTSMGGGVRCRYPTQNVCHYLGIVGWNFYCANVSFFVSTFRIWSRQYHA